MKDGTANQLVAVLGFHDGSAGQVESWFEQATRFQIDCFVHESSELLRVDAAAENAKRATKRMDYPSDTFKGRPLIVSTEWVRILKERGVKRVLPLSPDNKTRLRQIKACREAELELVSAIHPSVLILSGATIEPGCWINAGSIIGYQAEVRAGVLLNTGVSIDHHNVLEECCQVDPGVTTAGNVTLRECSHVHTGATIINRIEIGAGARVGAGSVVIRNVPPGETVVGVPARPIDKSR